MEEKKKISGDFVPKAVGGLMILLALATVMLACVMLSGCSPEVRYVPQERVIYRSEEADTAKFMALIRSLREHVTQKESRIESLVHKESDKETIVLNDRGDTIARDRNHNENIHLSSEERSEYERTIESQRDSIRELERRLSSVRTDSIPVPYPVERKLTRWEKVKMDFGGIAIGAIIAVVCIAVVWLIRKFRK